MYPIIIEQATIRLAIDSLRRTDHTWAKLASAIDREIEIDAATVLELT
jgi:hypothetical protein